MMDKRKHPRFLIQRHVQLTLSSGRMVVGVTRDLSSGGSFIECDATDLRPGDEFTLSVLLDDGNGSIEIRGDIAYKTRRGVGCHFLTFDSGYDRFLSQYSLHPPPC